MLHNLLFQTIDEFRRPLLRCMLILMGAAWLSALAHPLLLSGGGEPSAQLPGWLVPFFNGQAALPERGEWIRVIVFGLVLPLLLSIFAAWHGSGLVAGEEERGSLGLLLAGPMLRHRVILIKFLALLLLVLFPALAAWLAVSLLSWLGFFPAAPWLLARAFAGLFLLGLAFGTIALALGSLTGKLRPTRAAALVITLVALLLHRLPVQFPGSQIIRLFSPFHYYGQAIADARFIGHAAALVLLVAAGLALAWLVFERRDLAV